ncbi:MAG: ABC transporter ATP-binding protein [bacterium]|nr:ABC transporter ATP-binding protein [bacterium]
MAILVLEDVSAAYSNSPEILKGLSLSLERGEQIAIIGRNGEGKTTLLKVAAGLLAPTRGKVRHFSSSNPAILLQNPRQQLVCSTVREEIEYTLRLNALDDKTVARVAQDRLQQFDLEHASEQHPLKLSGGQQQKVALAALLCREPELLLLDEPDAYLDGASRREFRSFFSGQVRAATIWIVSRVSELPEGMKAMRLANGVLSSLDVDEK